MSEYAHDDSSPPRQVSDSNLHNISLEDSANKSIIGKVKSKVSSILPNRLSKWFSPSTKFQNDSLNGSICGANSTLPPRRRRRLEVEEEESYEDDEDVEENNHRLNDENEDDESQNSDDDYNATRSSTKQTKRDLNVERQPPAKRSRLNTDVRESPVISRHQPLLSSTPAMCSSYSRNLSTGTSSVLRSSYQRFTNLNLYSNQSKKEPAFNFDLQTDTKSSTKINADIIDLISNPSHDHEDKFTETTNAFGNSRTGISSRKSLNIPSSNTTSTGVERAYGTIAQLKRQPLSSAKMDMLSTHTVGVPPRRTSTSMKEVEDQEVAEHEQEQYDATYKGEDLVSEGNGNNYNGRVEGNTFSVTNKKQKLINGTGLNTSVMPESNEAILLDSASESGESSMDVTKQNSSNTQQRKTGLFNMSAAGAATTRNSSRTSSFGNGLNFYSHLEGRKSLFSGPNHNISNTLNNSTLSLTSLNRRQFNASIYGSTSALSDSRLLNTFSPFYKGKTTYGGAAAYNKYTAGDGASAVRITPTLIRPTSSLSTLSSNNSVVSNINPQVSENSTISSTAKRILDLINDFATPLSEAKKMASSLKTNPNLQLPLQAKGRLNENDLNASRAMRLSQVRTPYSRPAVILQPSGNAIGRGTATGLLPPVKELQVPTMSQLLQMKKIQNTTEKARKIAQNADANTGLSEYTLPDMATAKSNTNANTILEHDQQKHTNKIRNKITNTLRSSATSKDLQDEQPPPPLNLHNIAFPLMESVPKIDINLNKTSAPKTNNPECKTMKSLTVTGAPNVCSTDSSKIKSFAFNCEPIKPITQITSVASTDSKKLQLPTTQTTFINATTASSTKAINTYKFSEPLQIFGVSTPIRSVTKNDIDIYKFSPPLDVIVPSTSNVGKLNNTQPKQPQLKEGSCLDALTKPTTLPPPTSKTNTVDQVLSYNTPLGVPSGFGNQFKKPTNEWECDVCMIRNKFDASKCVACETPRKQSSSGNQQQLSSSTSISCSSDALFFGQQFKKSSSEWECDVCMIRNKQEVTKCVACETPRKNVVQKIATALPPIKNSFGDAFKPKSGSWECQTCMISNKNEVNECVACQTKKPGGAFTTSTASVVPETQFKFGFTAAASTNGNSNGDAGFKTLAAQQKASKWECDACMTRNDANRTKCACCEQPKPGSTIVESTNSSSTKFQFGTTAAASKFNFGFGMGANTPKEDDLRKELVNKNESKPPASAFAAPTQGGFQFGIKATTIPETNENKKDETDANKKLTGFKFGVTPAAENLKTIEASTDSPAPKGFVFDSKSTTTTTTISTTITSTPALSSATAANSPSVKFALPTTTTTASNVSNNNKTTSSFGFGNSSTTTSTSGSFAFGSKLENNPATAVAVEKKALDSFAFKAPTTSTTISTTNTKSSGFVFGSTAIKSTATAVTTVSSSNNAVVTVSTSTTSSTSSPAINPIFSFGSNTSNTPGQNSQATSTFGGFSFGSNLTANSAAPTTTTKTLFAAITSTSTITTTANANATATSLSKFASTTTTPASSNIFGSFGGGSASSNVSTAPIFGFSVVNPPANNNLTSVSSSTSNSTSANTPTFGAFGSKTSNNVFGSFGGVSAAEGNSSRLAKPNDTKPTLPVFGNVATSSSSQSPQSHSGGFVFGSSTANNSTQLGVTASTTGSVTSTSTTWPKSSFVFGSSPAPASSTNTALPATNTNENKDIAKPSVFGTFGATSTNPSNQQQISSIFGVTAPSSGLGASSSGTLNSSTNLFGTNSAPTATSIFGANSSGNAATPTPAFASSPFGGAASSTSATPTFGSTAASGATTFGGFGAPSSNTTTITTEIKKPEAAFNFGAASATQSTTGGFNFGSSSATVKPAFNFGGTSTTQQPTFNFTGTATEGTPNTPFQFNSGAAPVSSNIFAPAPTPGAQTAQQAKRKIRAPIRRVTQR